LIHGVLDLLFEVKVWLMNKQAKQDIRDSSSEKLVAFLENAGKKP